MLPSAARGLGDARARDRGQLDPPLTRSRARWPSAVVGAWGIAVLLLLRWRSRGWSDRWGAARWAAARPRNGGRVVWDAGRPRRGGVPHPGARATPGRAGLASGRAGRALSPSGPGPPRPPRPRASRRRGRQAAPAGGNRGDGSGNGRPRGPPARHSVRRRAAPGRRRCCPPARPEGTLQVDAAHAARPIAADRGPQPHPVRACAPRPPARTARHRTAVVALRHVPYAYLTSASAGPYMF